ncbi:MAG: HipA domain-containing protein [Chthoniobacterales bacterium]
MSRCMITGEKFDEGGDYSRRGLQLLDRRLAALAPLPYSAAEQRQEAIERAGKMSVQGIQPKISAVLNIPGGRFDVVDSGGKFILKPPSADFAELPENEDLTMRLAASVGIETPLHGLLRAGDGSLTYFIRRFDREKKQRIPVEDFAQLSNASRDTKYESSMENIATVVERYCTFPALERIKLFSQALFSFLAGNEDMHLKNFSLITRREVTSLSPAYDLVNSTIVLKRAKEEMALPIRGKKSGITHNDLIRYFGGERLKLSPEQLTEIITRFATDLPRWGELIEASFLSPEMKNAYTEVIRQRWERLSG